MLEASPATVPTFRKSRAGSTCLPCRRYSAPSAATTKDAVDDGGEHVVGILGESPRVQDEGPEVGEMERAVRGDREPDRMLEKRVRRDDEIAGEPASEKERHRGEKMSTPSQAFLPPDEKGKEARLEEEREEPLHGQRVTDDVAGEAGEPRPVRAELELHGDSGHDSHREVEPEDPDPEARGVIPPLATRTETERLHDDDEERESHRQNRKEIVIDDREGELEAVKEERIAHAAV